MSHLSLAARALAERASLQAFANCYLREVDAGTWHTTASWAAASGVWLAGGETDVVELDLPSQAQTLALGVRFRSRTGRHAITQAYRRRHGHGTWQSIDGVTAQLLLIDALYAERPAGAQRLTLIGRVIESHQVMARYVQRWLARGVRLGDDFADSEASLVLGHWLHPTPKSRQGILDWQHDHYAPELFGRFRLHYFAAARSLVQQASLLDVAAEDLTLRLAQHEAPPEVSRRLAALDDRCILPLHPLQAQWLLHQDHVRALLSAGLLVDLGPLGPAFRPTSSVRTLYAEDVDVMIKLSIPVKITNSLRINLQSELGDSVWVSKLLRACGVAEAFPALHVIEDPAYITVALPDREETGFEVIFRANPFFGGRAAGGGMVHAVAALVQDPLGDDRRSLLHEAVHALAEATRISTREASRRWFDAYWTCAVEPPLGIYDRHGIALEAHQQNVLIELDARGLPRRSHYRDVQGVGMSECSRDQHVARVPELAAQAKVFEPADIVQNNLGYYLFFNQLYAVINRFGLDGLIEEAELLGVVRDRLRALRPGMQPRGVQLVDALLDRETMPCKGNLLTRVADMDELEAENELAVYTHVDNPLYVRESAVIVPAPRAAS